jgi:hypothetical protein
MLRVGPSTSGGGGGGTITAIDAGTGIAVAGGTGPTATITNTGVTGLVAGTGITVSSATGVVTVGASPVAPSSIEPGTFEQILTTNDTPAAQWITLFGDGVFVALGDLRVVSLESGTILADTTGAFHWWYGATLPTIAQDPMPSTGAGSGAAGVLMSMTAQAGQNATGAGNNGGVGGNLVLSSGAGGTSGSATAGATGELDLQVGGLTTVSTGTAGVGLLLASFTQSLGPGSPTLTPTAYLHPLIILTGTLPAARTVTFPNLAGLWLVDISALTGLSGVNTLTFASGSATTTPITSLTTNSNLLLLRTTGANGISINL